VLVKDQRKTQRFDLRLPFELVRSGATNLKLTGETRNLSSGGVLFTADADVQVGQPIEFLITLPTGSEQKAVRLRCMGKVVRLDRAKSASVAATVERFEFLRSEG
jgi:hypothetical protein